MGKNVFLWVSIVPAMLVTQFLSLTALHMWLMFIMSDSTFRTILVSIMPQMTGVVAGIAVAQYLAPSYKRVVAVSLAVLSLILIGAQAGLDMANGETGIQVWGAALGATIGSCVVIYLVFKNGEDLLK